MVHFLQRLFRIIRLSQDERYRGYWLAGLMLLLLVYSTGGIYLSERAGNEGIRSLGDALWWSMVTMTTVGYGDIYPATWQGRWLVAMPTMLLGIGVLGYAIGLVTTVVLERHNKEVKGMLPYEGADHVILCHHPSTETVCELVEEIRADRSWRERELVLVTDRLEELPDELRKLRLHFVHGDPSREESLTRAGIARAHSLMVLARDPGDPSSDNQALGVVVTARSLRRDVDIVVECLARENTRLLHSAGASEVVGLGVLAAGLMVQGLQDPGVTGVLAELVSNRTGHQIYIEPIESFAGSYRELEDTLRGRGRYVVLGLVADGDRRFLPDPDAGVRPGHKVMLLGDTRPGSL